MITKSLPSYNELHKLFLYDYTTGKVFWKINRRKHKVGDEVGWLKNGYRVVTLHKGSKYYLHRIIFKMRWGHDPKYIDHINGDRLDNRIKNLRSCTKRENDRNRSGLSGFKGVSYCKRSGKFRVTIQNKEIARANTKEQAAIIYNKEAIKRYGEFAWLNKI